MVREVAEPYRMMTAEEFLEWSDGTDTRYELVDGFLYAQASTTISHAQMLVRIAAALVPAADRSGCNTSSGAGVKISEQTVYIPDIIVACDASADGLRNVGRPTIIVEILSESTARADRTEKRVAYTAIESMLSYLIVYQDVRRIDRHWRDDPASEWRTMTHTGGSVPLPVLDIELLLDDIYRGVDAPINE
jgi:Uma2 family endonuclease